MGLNDVILCIVLMAVITIAENDRLSSILNPRLRRTAERRDLIKQVTGVPVTDEPVQDDDSILVEGDMYLSQEQYRDLYTPATHQEWDVHGSARRTKRQAVANVTYRWTNGIIPYTITENFTQKHEYMMKNAMTTWERYTCLQFRPATPQDKYVIIIKDGKGCNSLIGMQGIQIINLEILACSTKRNYLHEMGHAIGLNHEHQRPDRDGHIRILYENIIPEAHNNFKVISPKYVNNYSVPYDLSSVMHYGRTAFQIDDKIVMEAVNASENDFLNPFLQEHLSYNDVWIVNRMYNCSDHCPDKNKCGSDGHLDQNCNCICKDGSSDCDTTKKTSNDGTCVNKFFDWKCHVWADEGQCERNPFYMGKECAKACGKCGSQPSSQGECRDVHGTKCPVWKERGECITNEKWMSSNCRATCNMCGDVDSTPEVNCDNALNDTQKCEIFAKEGECEFEKDWMLANCRKTCRACTIQNFNASLIGQEVKWKCEDNKKSCEAWARRGECEKTPSYMLNHCRKACKSCEDGTCKNLKGDKTCYKDAQDHGCLLSASSMVTECMKTCGTGRCVGTDPDTATYIIV